MELRIVYTPAHLIVGYLTAKRQEKQNRRQNNYKAHGVDCQNYRRNSRQRDYIADIALHNSQKSLNIVRGRLYCQNKIVVKIGVVIAFEVEQMRLFIKRFVEPEIQPFLCGVPIEFPVKQDGNPA